MVIAMVLVIFVLIFIVTLVVIVMVIAKRSNNMAREGNKRPKKGKASRDYSYSCSPSYC
jgi:uncharacterized membrane protein